MDKKRDKSIIFRVSEEDKQTLETYASAEGKSLSEFLRAQAFRVGDRIIESLVLPDGTVIPVDQLNKARFKFIPDKVGA